MTERKCTYMVLAGKPEGKTVFGRPEHRCDDNINVDI
jgi:hypothetical protein